MRLEEDTVEEQDNSDSYGDPPSLDPIIIFHTDQSALSIKTILPKLESVDSSVEELETIEANSTIDNELPIEMETITIVDDGSIVEPGISLMRDIEVI